MNFLNPTLALVGLACVAIPIAIHILMRRRRKPVAWAAMRFLVEAYRQQRRRLRLEQLLLLAARCLIIALVALALGRPFFGEAAAFGGRSAMTLYLLIDNGLASSATQPGEGDASATLERQKEAAAALLAGLDPAAGDRAALIALGGPAQPLVLPPTTDTGALSELVRNLKPTASATDIAGGIAAVSDNLAENPPGSRIVIAVLSDFLTGSADPERPLVQLSSADAPRATLGGPRGTMVLLSSPAESGADNISITAVEPLRPIIIAPANGRREAGQRTPAAPVRIVLQRSGPGTGEAAITTVNLAIERPRTAPVNIGRATVRWSPGQTEATASVPMDTSALAGADTTSAGALVLVASIDPDAIVADNQWRRPVEVRRALRIGIIAPRRLSAVSSARGLDQFESADWARLALSPAEAGDRAGGGIDSELEVTQLEPNSIDAARLAGIDAAIITRPDLLSDPAWSRLRAFADSGGLIVIIPPREAQVHLWPDAMSRLLGLPWTIAREARQYEEGQTIATDRSAAEMQVGAGRGLLAMVQAELPDLARPVRISRILPLESAETPGEQQAGADPASSAVLRLQDGTPLITAASPTMSDAEAASSQSRGLVVYIAAAFAFDWTDLQARPLMVPLLQEIIRQGVGQAIGSRTQLAGALPEFPAGASELRNPATGETVRPILLGGESAALRDAGLWQATDQRGIVRSLLAVNADPAGARTDAQPAQTIRDWLATAILAGEVRFLDTLQPAAAGEGASAGSLHTIFDRRADDALLAIPLLIAALAIALLELALGRWFSHAARPASASTGSPAPAGPAPLAQP